AGAGRDGRDGRAGHRGPKSPSSGVRRPTMMRPCRRPSREVMTDASGQDDRGIHAVWPGTGDADVTEVRSGAARADSSGHLIVRCVAIAMLAGSDLVPIR